MKPGQVTVQAQDSKGNHGTVDVLDLDERSFRAWLLERLMLMRVISYYDGNSPALRRKGDVPMTVPDGVISTADRESEEQSE